jgi:hypothetical protein
MIDGNAFPQPQNRTTKPAPTKRPLFSAQVLPALLVVLGVAIATFVLYLYVLPNSQIDAAKMRIANLQAQKATLERENAALLREIALTSNLKTLEIRAQALGMGPANNAIYLSLPSSNATSPATPVAEPVDTEIDPAPTTLTDWLQRERLQDLLRDLRWQVSQVVDRLLQRLQAN